MGFENCLNLRDVIYGRPLNYFSETERGISQLTRQLENREKELNTERNIRKKLEKQFEKKTEKKLINDLTINNNKPFAYF